MTQMPEMLGQAPAMQDVFRAIGRLSQSNVTVLITGESGAGKELVGARCTSTAHGEWSLCGDQHRSHSEGFAGVGIVWS